MSTVRPAPVLLRLRAIAEDIKIAHSVFALPFALFGAAIAVADHRSGFSATEITGLCTLIILAMVCARTSAMLANRLLDHQIDARNPRTRGRALPSRRITRTDAWGAWLASSLAFVAIACAFGVLYANWWPTMLSVPVLLWLGAYGLLKRWTALCHVYLGLSLAMSPLAAAIAVHPASLSSPAIWLLAAMVVGWVAGFDIIYALQDEEVDRAEGLHSIPSRFGAAKAMWISRALHAGAAAALIGVWRADDRLGPIFAAATMLTITLLIAEQATVASWGTRRIALTFFLINGIVSCLVGAAGIADLLIA